MVISSRIRQIRYYYAEYVYKARTKHSLDYAIEITIKNLLIDMRFQYGENNR